MPFPPFVGDGGSIQAAASSPKIALQSAQRAFGLATPGHRSLGPVCPKGSILSISH